MITAKGLGKLLILLLALVDEVVIAVVVWIYVTGPASACGMLGYIPVF